MFGSRVIEHAGAINGFFARIYRFVDDDATAICLFNFESTFSYPAADAIAAIALGRPAGPLLVETPTELPPTLLQSYAGRYQVAPQIVFTVSTEGGRLYVKQSGRLFLEEEDDSRHLAIPQAENRFFAIDLNLMVTFLSDGAVPAPRALLQQGMHSFPAERVPE
jgi:hypothetical protein